LETKTAPGGVKLLGTHPQIKEYFRHLGHSQGLQHPVEITIVRLHKRAATRHAGKPFRSPAERVGVFVQADEAPGGAKACTQGSAVPPSTHSTVQENVVRGNREPLHDFIQQHRNMHKELPLC
jgi:hypothetical protein